MSANILALDTATENCSVALMANGQLYTRSQVAPRDHTKLILPMVDEVLKEAGLKLVDLDALAFGRGPGSFTGVRIGIGIAQGLAFGADLPMIGISTLKAMAQGSYRQQGAQRVAVAIDARMSEVYWACYERQNDGSWLDVEPERVIPPLQLTTQTRANDHSWVSAGTGWETYGEVLKNLPFCVEKGEVLYPNAEDMVHLAQQELALGNTMDAEEATPVYLRDTVAWKKLPGRE